MDNTNAVLAPLVSENVKGGLWSLTAHYGRGDEARDAMRKQADALRQPTQSDEWQAGYEAGIEAAAKALKADAKLCDCAALEANECACGAWDDYKSISSARAIEIVRALKELG